jgi:hypothetical protein
MVVDGSKLIYGVNPTDRPIKGREYDITIYNCSFPVYKVHRHRTVYFPEDTPCRRGRNLNSDEIVGSD